MVGFPFLVIPHSDLYFGRGSVVPKGRWKTAGVVFIIVFSFLSMLGYWAIDISFSAMATNSSLTNGFWVRSPIKQYHLGLYLAIFSHFFVCIIAAYSLLGAVTGETDSGA